MNKKLFALLALIILCTLPGRVSVAAGDSELGYVNDDYGVLTDEQIEELAQSAVDLFETNGVDFVTVLTSRFAGNDAHKYATDLFNSVGIGDATLNNGILLFVAYDSGDIELVTGDGIKSTITNGTAGKLIDTYFIPKARSAPDEAVMELHAAIVEKAYEYYEGIPTPTESTTTTDDYYKGVPNQYASSKDAHSGMQQSNKAIFSMIITIMLITVAMVAFFAIMFALARRSPAGGRHIHTTVVRPYVPWFRFGRRHHYGHHHHHHGHGHGFGLPPRVNVPPPPPSSSSSPSGGHSTGSGAGRSFGSSFGSGFSSSKSSSSRSSSSRSSSSSRRSSGGRSSGGGSGRKF